MNALKSLLILAKSTDVGHH